MVAVAPIRSTFFSSTPPPAPCFPPFPTISDGSQAVMAALPSAGPQNVFVERVGDLGSVEAHARFSSFSLSLGRAARVAHSRASRQRTQSGSAELAQEASTQA